MDNEKAYNEVQDKMRDSVIVPENKEALQVLKQTIIPELRESEDNKINKTLLKCFTARKSKESAMKICCPECANNEKNCGLKIWPSRCRYYNLVIKSYSKAEKDTIERIREEIEKRKKENQLSIITDGAEERFSEDCRILSLLDEMEKNS